MNLNPSNPGNRWAPPLRSPRLSYLFWVGATSASSLGALSFCALMADQAGATTVIPPTEEMTAASTAIGVPDLETSSQTAIATLPMRSPNAVGVSVGLPTKGDKPASSSLHQPSPILPTLDLAVLPATGASEAPVAALQPHEAHPSTHPDHVSSDELEPVPDVLTEASTEVAQAEPLANPSTEEPLEAPVEASSDELIAPADAPVSTRASDLGVPLIRAQGAVILQDDDFSARARLTGSYAITPNVMVGATVDLTTGDAFSDSREDSFNLNELYVAVTPDFAPNFRVIAGLMDLTSYFDRNSFAKDSVTHFLNPVFQTNPALAAAGIGSRPGLLVNWTPVDTLDIKVATFSSDRDLGNFELDAVAGEVGVRVDNFILRGTFASSTDSGEENGFEEIFQFDRGDDQFGLQPGDREDAFGLNAELFIPSLNVGLFGRYGWYENRDLDRGGQTFSFGFNVLDLFLPDDRLGLAYGQQLSNSSLRDDDEKTPDVVELFYDLRLNSFLRAGVSLQGRDELSETVLGFRLRADFDLTGPRGIFR
jgi:hypothetical protein